MYARLGALVCLLSVGAWAARANEDSLGSGGILVYLRESSGVSPSVIAEMRRETSALLRSAGLRVSWSGPPERPEIQNGLLVVASLAGECDSDPELWAGAETLSRTLAFTPLENGNVLPFSTVNCSSLGQFLSPALRQQPKARRDYLYGRAMGRVLAHELYHVIAQTRGHSREGVGEAAMSVRDLTGEQFVFGEDALFRLQNPAQLAVNGADVLDVASGR
jgi:hypothetical protein